MHVGDFGVLESLSGMGFEALLVVLIGTLEDRSGSVLSRGPGDTRALCCLEREGVCVCFGNLEDEDEDGSRDLLLFRVGLVGPSLFLGSLKEE